MHRRLRGFAVAVFAVAVAACSQGGASSAAPSGSSAPFVGTWKSVLTAEDWDGTGIPNVEENTGEVTHTFGADGSWTTTWRSLTGFVYREPVFTGIWTSQGNLITMTTSFPELYKGFVDIIEFRVEGDLLHLKATNASDEYVPVIFGAHPWARS